MNARGPQKISDCRPDLANAKVSVVAMWEHLNTLNEVADDPAKVKKWGRQIWKELSECKAC